MWFYPVYAYYTYTHGYMYISSWNRGNKIVGVFSLPSASILLCINISRNRFHDVYFLTFLWIYVCCVHHNLHERNIIESCEKFHNVLHLLLCVLMSPESEYRSILIALSVHYNVYKHLQIQILRCIVLLSQIFMWCGDQNFHERI